MKYQNVKAKWPIVTREERMFMEVIAAHELDKQKWASIVYLNLWGSEGLVCTQ